MGVVEMVRANPPGIFGIHLQTRDDAVALWLFSNDLADFTCRLLDKIGNSWEVQIEGVETATAVGGPGQWIILDGKEFLVLSDEERAARGYSIKT